MEQDFQKKALSKYPQSGYMDDTGEIGDHNELARLAYLEGCRDTVKIVRDKVQSLIERYGAIVPKDSYSKIFQGARLMGYGDVDTYLKKLNP